MPLQRISFRYQNEHCHPISSSTINSTSYTLWHSLQRSSFSYPISHKDHRQCCPPRWKWRSSLRLARSRGRLERRWRRKRPWTDTLCGWWGGDCGSCKRRLRCLSCWSTCTEKKGAFRIVIILREGYEKILWKLDYWLENCVNSAG